LPAVTGERDFPADFLWGSATAAHQVEGGNVNNDWWEWEHRPGTPAVESSGDGIDHLHRYAEDLALMADLGHSAHRFSVEWSRLEPAPGEWSAAGCDHYRRVRETAAEHDLAAFVTLQHFTLPRWLSDEGGWLAPHAVDRFADFAGRVARELGDLVPWFCTINEPSVLSRYGYDLGLFPPGVRDPAAADRVTERLVAAHGAAVEAVRAESRDSKVGITLSLAAMQPAREDADCTAEVARLRERLVTPYLDAPAGDFLGVQYYTLWRIDPLEDGSRAEAPPGTRLTQMGWEIHPAGLREVLHEAAAGGLPLIVTENGIATDDDDERLAYVEAHVRAMAAAMADGVDVRGYLYWSAFDNFEWNDGYRPRFGMVAVDRTDGFRREPRASALAFGRLARTGRLTSFRAEG
jgi:beta-glucosidase